MAEPLNATFFTLQHRDRAVLLPATLTLLGILALIIALGVALNWGALSQIFQFAREAGGKPSEQAAIGFISGVFLMFGSILLLLFPFYIALAAYEAACLRWMIRGETPGLFGLTLDADTWRVYGVYWCWLAVHFVVGFAMSIIMFPLMFMMLGDVMAHGGKPDPDAMLRWQWSVQLPVTLLQYVPLIFLGVRLGPAAAASVARRRFAFLEAWQVTKGRFLSLLGSFALLWLIFGLVGIAIFAALMTTLLGDVWRGLFATWPQPPSSAEAQRIFSEMFSPRSIAIFGVTYAANIAVLLVYVVMSYGVNARAALAAMAEGKIPPAAPVAAPPVSR